jgi:hypothetical protein
MARLSYVTLYGEPAYEEKEGNEGDEETGTRVSRVRRRMRRRKGEREVMVGRGLVMKTDRVVTKQVRLLQDGRAPIDGVECSYTRCEE